MERLASIREPDWVPTDEVPPAGRARSDGPQELLWADCRTVGVVSQRCPVGPQLELE